MWFEEETYEYDKKYYDSIIFSQNVDEGSLSEVFIVSKDWSWTYVYSHEAMMQKMDHSLCIMKIYKFQFIGEFNCTHFFATVRTF